MSKSIVSLIALAALAAVAYAGDLTVAYAEDQAQTFNWDPWRHVAVQDGGRRKPLDTLAWETARAIGNRTRFTDPVSGRELDATAAYLAMLFDWEGWDKAPDPHRTTGAADPYFGSHQADKWDQAPLLRVDYLALREVLGMAPDQKYISPEELSRAKVQDSHSGQGLFTDWVVSLYRRRDQGLTPVEEKSLRLAEKLGLYQAHRTGSKMEVLPVGDSEDQQWLSVARMLRTNFTDETDPTGGIRKVKGHLIDARTAYRDDSAESFNAASAAFISALREFGPQIGPYPDQATIGLEVAYNRWVPFRFGWVLMLIASLCLMVSMGSQSRLFYVAGVATFCAGLAALMIGFGMRVGISGRAPVTNMYESVIYLGSGVAILGLILECVSRKRYMLTAAAGVCAVALVLADNCPAVLDPSFRPLQPVLRSNFWLVIHVMSITLSYAAFALALGVGNITLGFYLFGSQNAEAIKSQGKLTHKSLQVGVLLLAAGTILGGVWAAYSWGRFWGWDPKEVWALIALLGYLAVLHARYAGWVGHRGLAALSVICFSLVMMAWYGVNFVLGTGLHSYGFGEQSGQLYVFAAVAVQFLYVATAMLVSTLIAARGPADGSPPAGEASPETERRASLSAP